MTTDDRSPELTDESFSTADIAAAESIVQRVYPVAELRESRRRFWFEQSTRGEGGINFARFKISSWVDIAVEFERVAAFGLVLGGQYSAQSGGSELTTHQPFLFTPGEGTSTSEQLDLLMVNIDEQTLARAAATRLGVDSVRLDFRGHEATSPAMREHWLRTIGYAWNSVVRENDVFYNPLTRTATFEAVTAAALAAFPIEILHPGRMRADEALSSSVRRARQYIEEHPDQPMTVEAIAREARTSVRSLQYAFRRELETSPLAYLRRIRLIHARDDLLDAEPGGTTVGAVARRWGFVNVGRFAADYSQLFGENPSHTLRR